MKKLIASVSAALALSLLTVPAAADAIVPGPAEMASEMAGPVFALSIAVIAVVVLIRTILRKRKKK